MQPTMAVYSGMFLLTAGGTYSVVVWTECKMMIFLKSQGSAMLQSTRRLHTEVHRALIATVPHTIQTHGGEARASISEPVSECANNGIFFSSFGIGSGTEESQLWRKRSPLSNSCPV